MATTKMLLDAARNGKLDVLDYLVKENPAVVADFRLKSPGQPLLHEATKCQQLSFVRELMKMDSQLHVAGEMEMDMDGFRPLDIAVIMGNLEIVKELLGFNQDLCALKGKDGKTALLHAALNGRIDAIQVLLNSSPDSIEDLTVHGETVLHLALKNHQFDAFIALLEWVERLSKEYVVNMADNDGNTVLHLAALTKQYACVDVVLAKHRGTVDLNARNQNGWTVVDCVDVQDAYDAKMNEKLEHEGAVRSPGGSDVATWVKQARCYRPESSAQDTEEDWFSFFKFKKQRDSPGDARNVLLVVAILIATICFQSCAQPPGGIFSKKSSEPTTHPPPPPRSPPAFIWPTVTSGVASISGWHATPMMFMFANSLGFMSAICIVIYMTAGYPFKRELHLALYSVMFTYGFAAHSAIKDEVKLNQIWAYVALTLAFTLPVALRWLPRWGKKAWIHWRQRQRDAMPMRTPNLPIQNPQTTTTSI